MDTTQVMELWHDGIVCDADVSHYLCERFKLTPNVHFNIAAGVIRTDNEATWDRVFWNDRVVDDILNNGFLDTNPRLKCRMYLGVKRSDPSLLSYYYKYHAIVTAKGVSTFHISKESCVALTSSAPLKLDDRRRLCVTANGRLVILDTVSKISVAIIAANGVVSVVDGNADLEFLLPNAQLLLTVYNDRQKRGRRQDNDNEHRRPKIRRRCTAW
jgi:hypothetical protein